MSTNIASLWRGSAAVAMAGAAALLLSVAAYTSIPVPPEVHSQAASEIVSDTGNLVLSQPVNPRACTYENRCRRAV